MQIQEAYDKNEKTTSAKMLIIPNKILRKNALFGLVITALISFSNNSFAEIYKCMLAGSKLNENPFVKANSEQWGSIEINGNTATFINAVSKSTEKLNYSETFNDSDSSRILFGKDEFGITTAINFVKYKDPNKAYFLQHGTTKNDKTIKTYYNCMKN